MRPKPESEKRKTYSLTLHPRIIERLRAASEERGYSVSRLIELSVDSYLGKVDVPKAGLEHDPMELPNRDTEE